MKPGSDTHMFCTTLQLSSLYKFLMKEIEEMDDRSTSCSDSKRTSITNKEAVFNMESFPLHCSQAVETYNQYLRAREVHQTNVMEKAIHF